MTSTDTLKHEHRIVLLILDAAQREARSIRGGGRIRVDRLGQMIDFFRTFVDRCHHAKEEKHLFPTMKKRSRAKAGGPVAVLLREHREGRVMVSAMTKALPKAARGDGNASAALAQNLRAYVRLLRNHTGKEDDVVYPLADEVLSREDHQVMVRAFERVEAKQIGEGVHEKYHQLAHDLAKR
jgi:hemerythrin-like domain-containing protein